MAKLAKAQMGKIVKSVAKTATKIPGVSKGRVTGYSKQFKSKYNNAVNAMFLGSMGVGAVASGAFDRDEKKPVVKSDTTSVKKRGGIVKSKKK